MNRANLLLGAPTPRHRAHSISPSPFLSHSLPLTLCLALSLSFSVHLSLHTALRLLPISERSYVTSRELFALAWPNRVFSCLSHTHTYIRMYVYSCIQHLSLFFVLSSSLSHSGLTAGLMRVLGTHGVAHAREYVSISFSLSRRRTPLSVYLSVSLSLSLSPAASSISVH